jgi:hypothetical protein
MKKQRKQRATHAALKLLQGIHDAYVLVTPYDKRGREIPTSVSCAYNLAFFSAEEARATVGAI